MKLVERVVTGELAFDCPMTPLIRIHTGACLSRTIISIYAHRVSYTASNGRTASTTAAAVIWPESVGGVGPPTSVGGVGPPTSVGSATWQPLAQMSILRMTNSPSAHSIVAGDDGVREGGEYQTVPQRNIQFEHRPRRSPACHEIFFGSLHIARLYQYGMPAASGPGEKHANTKTFVPPWSAASQCQQDDFSMSQRWLSPFSLQRGSMQSSPSAPMATRTAVTAPAIQKRRAACQRDLSSSFQRRRAPFGSAKATTQGQIASQVLQSMQERSSQHLSEGAMLRPPGMAQQHHDTGKRDETLLKRVGDIEKRLARVHETIEGLVRGIGKYTALVTHAMESKDEEGLVLRVTAAVTAALGSLERDADNGADEGGDYNTRSKRPRAVLSRRPVSAGSCESCM